jgi:tRNA nucleotidyltransferase/poly(A) polymerase
MIVYYLDRFRSQLQAHLAQTWPNERPHAALLGLAALLHDSGKPATRAVMGDRIRFLGHEKISAALAVERATALRLSRAEIGRIEQIVLHHMRPHLLAQEPSLTRRAIYRFWRELGPAGIDVCLLAWPTTWLPWDRPFSRKPWGNYLLRIGALLDGAPGQETTPAADPLVTGDDLMRALGLKPGPRVGELLELIQEAQAVGEIQTVEEALRLAREHLG